MCAAKVGFSHRVAKGIESKVFHMLKQASSTIVVSVDLKLGGLQASLPPFIFACKYYSHVRGAECFLVDAGGAQTCMIKLPLQCFRVYDKLLQIFSESNITGPTKPQRATITLRTIRWLGEAKQ